MRQRIDGLNLPNAAIENRVANEPQTRIRFIGVQPGDVGPIPMIELKRGKSTAKAPGDDARDLPYA